MSNLLGGKENVGYGKSHKFAIFKFTTSAIMLIHGKYLSTHTRHAPGGPQDAGFLPPRGVKEKRCKLLRYKLLDKRTATRSPGSDNLSNCDVSCGCVDCGGCMGRSS